jgi:hypothetical protein
MTINVFNISRTFFASLICIFAFLVLGCKSKHQPEAESSIVPADIQIPTSNEPILGEWEKQYPFATEHISILPGGRFKYVHHGCTGISYSEGNWNQTGDKISLLSDSTYISDQLEWDKTIITIQVNDRQGSDISFLIPDTIHYRRNNLQLDSSRVFFADKKLIIRNGNLADFTSEGVDTVWIFRKTTGQGNFKVQ